MASPLGDNAAIRSAKYGAQGTTRGQRVLESCARMRVGECVPLKSATEENVLIEICVGSKSLMST